MVEGDRAEVVRQEDFEKVAVAAHFHPLVVGLDLPRTERVATRLWQEVWIERCPLFPINDQFRVGKGKLCCFVHGRRWYCGKEGSEIILCFR